MNLSIATSGRLLFAGSLWCVCIVGCRSVPETATAQPADARKGVVAHELKEIVLDEDGEWVVSVYGIVDFPGLYRVKSGTTLLRVLLAAGLRKAGVPLPHSALHWVQCVLLVDGRPRLYTMNVSRIMGNPSLDLPLCDGAKITVPELLGM